MPIVLPVNWSYNEDLSLVGRVVNLEGGHMLSNIV